MTIESTSHAVGAGAVSLSRVGYGTSAGTSAGSVTASSNQSWCTPRIGKTDSGFLLTVDCDANPNTSGRSATVTITNGCASKTVTINQAAMEIIYEFTLNDSAVTKNPSASGTTGIFVIVSKKNGNAFDGFSCGTVPDWITVIPGGTTSGGYEFVYGISVKENTSSSSRSATITFTQSESNKKVSFTITQAGKTDQTGRLRFYFGASSGQPSAAKITAEIINTTTGESEEMNAVEILANSYHQIGLKAGTWRIQMGEIKESSYPNRTGLCTPGCVYSGSPSNIGGRITNVTITANADTDVTCQPGWSS